MLGANRLIGSYGIVLVDRNGQLVISTRRGPGEPLPKRSFLDTQDKVFATGQPQVSGLIGTAAAENFIVSAEVPVRVGGDVRYVLAAGLSPKYFAEVMKKLVPPEWIGSIVDQQRDSHLPRSGLGVVGRPIVPILLAHVGQSAGRWIDDRIPQRRQGLHVLRAFNPSWLDGFPGDAPGNIELGHPAECCDFSDRGGGSLSSSACSWLGSCRFGFWARSNTLQHNVAALGRGEDLEQSPPRGLSEVADMERVLAGVSEDIAAARERVERERILLKATVQAMPVGVLIVGPDGSVLLVNRKALVIWSASRSRNSKDFTKVTRLRLDGSRYPPAHGRSPARCAMERSPKMKRPST